jgi:prophage regulatory protein
MRLLKRPVVEDRTGLSKSVLYDKIRRGEFPRPVSVTAKAVAWVEAEVNDWIASCVAERDARGAQ